MSCQAAIVPKAISLTTDMTVEDALKAMKKAKTSYAPVVDEKGIIAGLFSYKILMKNLLPVSVPMNDGTQLDVQIQSAPGIAKRLRNVQLITIDTLMERKEFPIVYPETPVWEGVSMMVKANLPLTVVEPETQKYGGFITQQSLFEEIDRIKDSE